MMTATELLDHLKSGKLTSERVISTLCRRAVQCDKRFNCLAAENFVRTILVDSKIARIGRSSCIGKTSRWSFSKDWEVFGTFAWLTCFYQRLFSYERN